MKITRVYTLAGILLLGAILALTPGCGKKKKAEVSGEANFPTPGQGMEMATDAPGSETTETTTTDPTWVPLSDLASIERTAGAGTMPERRGGEQGVEGAPIPDLAVVYFALDSFEIDSSAQALIVKNADYLKKNEKLLVVLRGHTDDTGTEEYNMSLGSQRAQAVRDVLVAQGVSGDRLQTVSFGENLHAVEGTSEDSRALNRRVEFFVYTLE